MKKVLNFKNLLVITLADFAVMAVMAFANDGADMVPLDADGHYSYPDFCVGHEEEFLVNANTWEYQKGLYVNDLEYIGDNGDF